MRLRATRRERAGRQALDTLNTFAATPQAFAKVIGLPAGYPGLAETVRARVVDKLTREPIEDYRLDFEDGYGTRSDMRGGRTRGISGARSGSRDGGRNAAALHRHSHQAAVTRAPCPKPAHPGHLHHDTGEDGSPPAGQLRGDGDEGDDAGARERARRTLLGARAQAAAEAPCHSTRADDRDPAGDPGAGRHRGVCGLSSMPAAGAFAARISASTTTRPSAASPRPGSIRAISPATWRAR